MTHKVIDVWMQHPTARFINQPFFDSLKRWQAKEEITEVPFAFTEMAMKEGNVEKALISAWCGPQGFLISNDEVAEFVSENPARYVGVAAVDVTKPVEAIKELRRCVNELGFKALRIVQWLWNLPSDHRLFYPLYAECVALDIPVCLQVGHTGPLCPSEPGRPIPYLDHVALEFPELKIIGGHVGYPWTQEMIAVATKHPNVYIDTSAYTSHRLPEELIRYMKGNGKEKVMFGTNYPMILPKASLAKLDELELSDEVEAMYLTGNAKKVFKL